MTKPPSTVYFHGMPGSPSELDLFRVGGPPHDAWLYAPNRNALGLAAERHEASLPNSAAYFDRLAQEAADQFPNRPLHLVGFSLGAFVAIEIAGRLGDRVERIDLISAAAPLQTGDYLGDMAGAAVFRLARNCPPLFHLLATLQSLVARIAPGRLLGALFSKARGLGLMMPGSGQGLRLIWSLVLRLLHLPIAGRFWPMSATGGRR